MILFHKDYTINPKHIGYKKKHTYSDKFTFIPIHYQKKELIIQTPLLFIPFKVRKYSITSRKQYLDLSFQSQNNDFIQFLMIIYMTIFNKYSKEYQIEHFFKESEYSKWMRFKINDHCLFFNQSKQQINTFNPKSFGNFIIHLSGLWIMNQKIWFNWEILQSKIHIPIQLKEYMFIDEKKSPPLSWGQ